jgi:anti-anti-sigma regulatory factor
MSTDCTSTIRVTRTTAGFVVRVEGWGTMRESPLLQGFARECLQVDPSPLVVDLAACSYLDSTFLGCLVDLHHRFGRDNPPRFLVAADPQQCRRLLAPLQLHRVLKVVDEAPQAAGSWLTLDSTEAGSGDSDRRRLGRHLLDCHRRLAELGGANETVFGPIIEQLARELEACEPPQPERSRVISAPRQPVHAS